MDSLIEEDRPKKSTSNLNSMLCNNGKSSTTLSSLKKKRKQSGCDNLQDHSVNGSKNRSGNKHRINSEYANDSNECNFSSVAYKDKENEYKITIRF